jgi:hypothetical protein
MDVSAPMLDGALVTVIVSPSASQARGVARASQSVLFVCGCSQSLQ